MGRMILGQSARRPLAALLACAGMSLIGGCMLDGSTAEDVDSQSAATLFCNRTYSELTVNPPRPYNAVGFLNNGCTAFLISADHIAAASHCFADNVTGAWQTGLRFYPNFHPSRVTTDAARVPRADVGRVVVGARVSAGMGDRMDWGIARLQNWRDTAGLDLTPIALASVVPTIENTQLVSPAYTRHHFPFNDNDAVTWDNMQWDTTHCGWVDPDKGMWAITMRPAPLFNGVTRDTVGCNSRWGSGFIHADCGLRKLDNDLVIHNCDVVGGSSGSPILYKNSSGVWSAIGVTHGGGQTNFALRSGPTCTNYNRDDWAQMGNGPSVNRFREAPRFASNVAVHRRADNASATALYAVDSDRNVVVYRSRTGATPNYSSSFDFWKSLGSPVAGGRLSRIAACAQNGARPELLVTVNDNSIYSRAVSSAGTWGAWTNFGLPAGVTSVVDLDASTDANGWCQLFVVANNGNAYTRTKTSDTTWGSWVTLASGQFNKITALRYDGTLNAAMIDSAGDIWRMHKTGAAAWTVPVRMSKPSGVSAFRDIDMTWDEAGRGFMLALSSTFSGPLDFVPMYGTEAWTGWRHFGTQLWAPEASSAQPAPTLRSLTASRWMEDAAGVTSPNIFATDNQGNIYFIEYQRVTTPGWVLNWKSFYHETIPY